MPALLLLALCSSGLAATLSVGASGTYATISAAVSAATSGDTLEIAAGTYVECVDLGGKDLALQGAGPTSTVIDGGGTCTAAVLADGGTLDVEHSVLTGNKAQDGGSVYLTGGVTALFADTELSLSTPSRAGGAVYADSTIVDLELDGCKISANTTGFVGGGGVYALAGTLTSSDNTWLGNTAENYGGALLVGASLVSTGDTFQSNTGRRRPLGGPSRTTPSWGTGRPRVAPTTSATTCPLARC